ncbi:MAG: hypothetical protein GXY74_12215 [Phycisphaerae bacterium]|nr:hypothetical protein [Phycisphaerae bacterium]
MGLRVNWPAGVISPPDCDGGQIVELWDNTTPGEESLIAEYQVGWYGKPRSYRLLAAFARDNKELPPTSGNRVPEITQGDVDEHRQVTASTKNWTLLDKYDFKRKE